MSGLEAGGKPLDPAHRALKGEVERIAAALPQAAKAVEDLEFALAQPPELAGVLLCMRAQALARRGKHAEAAASAEEARLRGPRDILFLKSIAISYALNVAAVARGRDPKTLSAEEAALRQRYADAAVEALRELKLVSPPAAMKLLSILDPDLDSLREHAAFRKLMDEVKPPGNWEGQRKGAGFQDRMLYTLCKVHLGLYMGTMLKDRCLTAILRGRHFTHARVPGKQEAAGIRLISPKVLAGCDA